MIFLSLEVTECPVCIQCFYTVGWATIWPVKSCQTGISSQVSSIWLQSVNGYKKVNNQSLALHNINKHQCVETKRCWKPGTVCFIKTTFCFHTWNLLVIDVFVLLWLWLQIHHQFCISPMNCPQMFSMFGRKKIADYVYQFSSKTPVYIFYYKKMAWSALLQMQLKLSNQPIYTTSQKAAPILFLQ